MRKITSILTFFAVVTLAASACAPQLVTGAGAGATTPEPTSVVTPTTGAVQSTPEPVVNTPATPAGGGPTAEITAEPAATTPTAPAAEGQPAVMTPEPTLDTSGGPAADGQNIVTLDDRGKTINLKVGQSFLLKLGEQYDWQVSISDQNVVSRVRNIAVVRGAQGVYDANQAGTVTLSATGDPLCRQSKPQCMVPSLMFSVTIVVK